MKMLIKNYTLRGWAGIFPLYLFQNTCFNALCWKLQHLIMWCGKSGFWCSDVFKQYAVFIFIFIMIMHWTSLWRYLLLMTNYHISITNVSLALCHCVISLVPRPLWMSKVLFKNVQSVFCWNRSSLVFGKLLGLCLCLCSDIFMSCYVLEMIGYGSFLF